MRAVFVFAPPARKRTQRQGGAWCCGLSRLFGGSFDVSIQKCALFAKRCAFANANKLIIVFASARESKSDELRKEGATRKVRQ